MNKYNFTKWFKWEEKGNINDLLNFPGIYIIALNPNLNNLNLIDNNIVYIGETNSTLEKRLNLFFKAMKDGKTKHSGGKSFKNKGYDNSNLYVSIYPIKEEDKIFKGLKKENIKDAKKAYIKYIERDLIKNIIFQNPLNKLLNKK